LLVQTVEREMRTERSGWRATSDSMKKIKQAVATINNNKENSSSSGVGGGSSNAPPPE
jgi:4-diphosphocytidyl-2C-methyl-D-erythritol kinase